MTDFPDERALRRLIETHNLFSCDGNGCSQPDCVWCTDVVESIQKSKEWDEVRRDLQNLQDKMYDVLD